VPTDPTLHEPSAAVVTAPPARYPRSLLLDLLRVFAAFWVVVFHWSYLTSTLPDWLYRSMRPGYLGVDIFFMLSGAVIIHTAIGRTWSSFAQSRFLRLFPVYVAASLLVVTFLILVGDATPDPESWIALTGLQFWLGQSPFIPVAWTLLYEVGFYALVAVLIAVNRGQLTEARIRFGVYAFLIAWLLASATDFEILRFVTLDRYGPLFMFGVLLGISRDAASLRLNAPALFVAGVLSYSTLLGRTDGNGWSDLSRILLCLGVLLVSGALILVSSMRPPAESRAPSRVSSWVATLSLMTYPIYLLHNEFGLGLTGWLFGASVPVPVAYLIGMGSVVVLSWLSVRFFEPWARAGLRRLLGWTTASRTAPPGETPLRTARPS